MLRRLELALRRLVPTLPCLAAPLLWPAAVLRRDGGCEVTEEDTDAVAVALGNTAPLTRTTP